MRILSLILLAGCPSKAPPVNEPQPDLTRPAPEPDPEPAAAPMPAPDDPAVRECIEECMHASMAEARSAESIRVDCEASCGTGAPSVVTTSAEVALMGGKRVKAIGTLTRGPYPTGGEGAFVTLQDGSPIYVDHDGVPEGWEDFVGMTISVVGTLGQGPTPSGQRIRIPFLEAPERPERFGEAELPAQPAPGLLGQ